MVFAACPDVIIFAVLHDCIAPLAEGWKAYRCFYRLFSMDFASCLLFILFRAALSQLGEIHVGFFARLSTCTDLSRRLLRFVVECSLPDAECRRVAASRLADIDAVLGDGLLPAGRGMPFGLIMSPRVRSSFDSVFLIMFCFEKFL